MQIKQLIADDDAVSPVIGVILMVAITVILAAVIGAFVLGIGGSQEKVPSASISFSEGADTSGSPCDYEGADSDPDVTVSHDGGDAVKESNLELDGDNWASCSEGVDPDDDVSAGDTAVVESVDGTLNAVWVSPSSDKTSILASYEP